MEADLLYQLKLGDKAAFAQLVAQFSPRVLNTCYRFLLNQQDAEDVSQEVFIEVYQSVKTFKGDAKLSTWIYRITVTKCLDELKKRNRKKRISSLGKILLIDEVANWLKGGAMPDKSLHEDDNFRAISKALNSLPDNQRVAFTLSKIDGYSNPEIAEIMNTTLNAVESLISRAKQKVSAELENILKNSLNA